MARLQLRFLVLGSHSNPRAWIALELSNDENPYDDRSGYSYGYDSTVRNYKQVKERDLLFIRSKTGLQGVGRINSIDIGAAQKEIARCPECRCSIGATRTRRNRSIFHCKNGHSFSTPVLDASDVRTFRARFGRDWIPLGNGISTIELRRFHLSKSALLSIMPANRDALVDFVDSWSSGQFRDRLLMWCGRSGILGDDEANEDPDLTPEGQDRREAVLRSIRLRRGQQEFRNALIKRYGGRCTFSGCSILGILEAAHLRPYRGPGDNHPANGFLLRSDLHTLFDLDMLGVNPENLRIAISLLLRGSEYQQFHGAIIRLANKSPPDPEALQLRWRAFCAANPAAEATLHEINLASATFHETSGT